MIIVIANKENYRIFNTPNKVILECDVHVYDDELGTTDRITKQLVLTEDMNMTVEHLTDVVVAKMAEYEQSFVSE
jgi:hypothetical protein